MNYITFILTVLFCTSPLFAQQPSISYLMCDEAKSQLQIHGSFGIDSGSVSIEDTTLGVVSWSDSLIICNLPDSGKGAGGSVGVKTINGTSNRRTLSIFLLKLYHLPFVWVPNSFGGHWYATNSRTWVVSWRIDIVSRQDSNKVIRFEASKNSYLVSPGGGWPYHDTSDFFDHGFTFSGIIDLQNLKIIFGQEKFKYGTFDTLYTPNSTQFDTNGFITGYINVDTGYVENGNVVRTKKIDSLYDAKILFPPNPKDIVSQQFQLNDPIKIWRENHSLIVRSENALGETTASLYTIDGRLLSRTKFDISAPGIFSFDVSDVHTHFAILVLQTSKGVITKKILLSEP